MTAGLALSFTPHAQARSRRGQPHRLRRALPPAHVRSARRATSRPCSTRRCTCSTGVVWLAIHIALLFCAAKLLKAPLFFVATGSMANVGGAASAPIVAGVYHPAMAPVGLLDGRRGLRARHLRRARLRVDARARSQAAEPLLRPRYSVSRNCQPTVTSAVLTLSSRGHPAGSTGAPGIDQSRLSNRRWRYVPSTNSPRSTSTSR